MRKIYFNIIYQHGSLIACCISLALAIVLSWQLLKTSRIRTLAISFVVVVTLISAEFYPLQLFWFPINLVYPISLIIIFIYIFTGKSRAWLTFTLLIVHSILLIIGLLALSSKSNTWGDGLAILGAFQVPNSAIIILYLSTKIRQVYFLVSLKLLVGILALVAIYIYTHKFETNPAEMRDLYFSQDVIERKRNAVICSLLVIAEGIILFAKRYFGETGVSLTEYDEQ